MEITFSFLALLGGFVSVVLTVYAFISMLYYAVGGDND